MNHFGIERKLVRGWHGDLAVRMQGNPENPAIVMTHSILSSAAMWDNQAAMLAVQGWFVVRIDTTGHGDSPAPAIEAVTMDGLARDTVAVMDALKIRKAHYVGLSLGGMSGFGLGIRYTDRLLSMVLCDARADAPPAVSAPWDERIAVAQRDGSCSPLAKPTIERWFGKEFVAANPAVATHYEAIAAATSVSGFVGCARAIQGLDYLYAVDRITVPVTMIVGANDGVLPEAMAGLRSMIPYASLETIPNAGHLPNVDQPAAFNVALQRHLQRLRH